MRPKENETSRGDDRDFIIQRSLLTAAVLSAVTFCAQAQEGVIFGNQGGLSIETANGNFSAGVGGRIHADVALYDDDVASLGSGTELRRAWLKLFGTLYRDWAYKIEYGFGDASAKDVYLAYTGFERLNLVAGNFKQPFSLSNMTSTNYLTFMERALPHEAIVPGRRIGLGARTFVEHWSLASGVFGETVEDHAGTLPDGREADSGISLGVRATFAPWHRYGRVLHFGGAVNRFDPGDGQRDGFRFRSRPESHVTDVRLVDTGEGAITGVQGQTLYGVESAAVLGPWSAQGEYVVADVGDSDVGDVGFDGWYVQSSYFLTGESRPYDVASGDFGRIKPDGAHGAWQIAVRYSSVDLNDGAIRGGGQDDVTVGLNWYANPRVRIMANYVAVVDHQRRGVQDEPQAFQMRFQADF